MDNMIDKQRSPYLVYVLRLWCDGPAAPWRAALDCAHTGERLPFTRLTELFAFLEAETRDAQPAALPECLKNTGEGQKSQTRKAVPRK